VKENVQYVVWLAKTEIVTAYGSEPLPEPRTCIGSGEMRFWAGNFPTTTGKKIADSEGWVWALKTQSVSVQNTKRIL